MIERCSDKRVLFQESALDPGMTVSDRGGTSMAHLDQFPVPAPVAGIAEPHQSTAAAILRAAGLGLFSAAEADLMIDRIRALAIRYPAEVLPASPDGTVT
ncbi:hypothetical protein ACFOWZ_07125 [Lentzea rhizosphaerae]|uniref:Uncharacterized protein n=1 Tax=Lentzea rhizosphaerae TaxID=2041025 RepID=A0ABV8BP55_9PSEU